MPQDQHDSRDTLFGLLPARPVLSVPSKEVDGKTVLITGAGGSIGSALAVEIGKHRPRHVVLLDASEQSLYRVSLNPELRAPYSLVLGSVSDRTLLDDLMDGHRPQIVFHAAAFKHVPLMEFNPFAAVENNGAGTFMLVQSAEKYDVEQLVMVSTDKAVEPASIMGASKRIAELIVLAMRSSSTQFRAVRLGNVLASEGSVLPLFQSQMERGEPLSVTHPQATRYFLSVQYAVQLLVLALSEEWPPGILVPELGKPIRIEEIARRMLADAASSQQIVFTGLRPGDKLAEKLISNDETYLSEDRAPLRRISSPSISLSELEGAMKNFEQAALQRDLPRLLNGVSNLVPSYKPSEVIQTALCQHPVTGSNR